MNKALKLLSGFDWILSGATLVFGLYRQDPLIIAVGVLGMLIAWYGPAARLKGYLGKKFIRKAPVRSDVGAIKAEDAFYAEPAAAHKGVPGVTAQPVAPDFSRGFANGGFYLHSSPHNVLRVAHLQLSSGMRKDYWA